MAGLSAAGGSACGTTACIFFALPFPWGVAPGYDVAALQAARDTGSAPRRGARRKKEEEGMTAIESYLRRLKRKIKDPLTEHVEHVDLATWRKRIREKKPRLPRKL